jgi:hypothetical protein
VAKRREEGARRILRLPPYTNDATEQSPYVKPSSRLAGVIAVIQALVNTSCAMGGFLPLGGWRWGWFHFPKAMKSHSKDADLASLRVAPSLLPVQMVPSSRQRCTLSASRALLSVTVSERTPSRRAFSRLVAIALVLITPLLSASLLAQIVCPSAALEGRALATALAPTLEFQAAEEDFPVLPFFTAFDGVDNNHNGLLDFADPDEIAPGHRPVHPSRPDRWAVSWSALYDAYRKVGRTLAVGRDARPNVSLMAALYRTRVLTSGETRELWYYLHSDGRAWARSHLDDLWPKTRRDTTRFRVLEYYFYYLRDQGLLGHPEDIETVFVFLPDAAADRCDLVVVVGAAHTDRTPNNVLVMAGQEAATAAPHIFVELGGHASIPDREPYGEFRFGFDVNWHADETWGPRDILAAVGVGWSGPYQAQMTLPRDPRWMIPAATDTSAGYRLYPMEPFERLASVLQTQPLDRQLAREAADSFFVALGLPAQSIADAKLLALVAWTEGLWFERRPETGMPECIVQWRWCDDKSLNQGNAADHQTWQHSYYRARPTAILRAHLFLSSDELYSMNQVMTYGYQTGTARRGEPLVGFMVGLPTESIRLPGYVEVQVGRLGGSFLYESSYKDYVSWFSGVSFDLSPSNLYLGGGISVLWPNGSTSRIVDLPRALRWRLGLRADRQARTGWLLQVTVH